MRIAFLKSNPSQRSIIFSRAKLFRYDTVEDPPEWKERGTGCIKILKNRISGQYRITMRRNQTLKVCANHNITKTMHLRPNCGSDRAFVWTTLADFSDGIVKPESLGIKFGSSETAKEFCEAFEQGVKAAETSVVRNTNDIAANNQDSTLSDPNEPENVETNLSDKMEKQLTVTDQTRVPVSDMKPEPNGASPPKDDSG